jgi:molybdopterin molybdotransferase
MIDTSSCASNAPENIALSAAEARQRMIAEVTPIVGHEFVPVRSALGRILAADIIAPHDVPAHDNSAMDGYAICFDSLAGDVETRLSVVGTAFAGNAFSGQVGKGQAVRIMTGAVLPAGADTVVVQEVTRVESGAVFIPSGQRHGQNTRRAGEDLARGAVALAAGKRIGPAELGLIASLGIAEVDVKRRLRVAFFSTGDELTSIGNPLAPGEIYDSNRYTLHGLLTRLGAEIIDMGVVPDRPEALEATLAEAALVADAIITTGGVSVGEADFIKEILAKLGEVRFLEAEYQARPPDGFRQSRQRLAVRPARQPGGGDGQLHPVRAGRAAASIRPRPYSRAAVADG